MMTAPLLLLATLGAALHAEVPAADFDAAVSGAVSAGKAPRFRPAPRREAPDVLCSVALPVGETPLDEKWARVSGPSRVHGPSVRGLSRREAAAWINAWVNGRLSYRADEGGDHWATAEETLARGAGDCEDYAILKMQLLRAAGVPDRDLYLVIASEGSHRDHAFLAVRAERGFLLLDNRADAPIEDRSPGEIGSVVRFSFSPAGGRWIHGYPAGFSPGAACAAPR